MILRYNHFINCVMEGKYKYTSKCLLIYKYTYAEYNFLLSTTKSF